MIASTEKKGNNLHVILEHEMSISSHVTELCKNLYFQIKKISSIRSQLIDTVTKTLATSLIFSRLDYCKTCTLLASLPKDIINRLHNYGRKYCSKVNNEIKEARPYKAYSAPFTLATG